MAVVTLIILGSLLGAGVGTREAEGQLVKSNFKIFLNINYIAKDEFRLEFTMNWGPNEYEENKISRPTPEYLQWADLQTFSAINSSRLDTLRNTTIEDTGLAIFSSETFFARVVLGGDFWDEELEFSLAALKDTSIVYYEEFEQLVIRVLVKPDASSYAIRPLAFIYPIFDIFLPETRVEILASPSVTLSSNTLNIYHYRLPDGETFTTENSFDLSNEALLYDVEKGEIVIQETPPGLTSATLFYFMVAAFFISAFAIGMASRGRQRKVPKGFFLWVKVGVFYFLAFIPYHFYITTFLIVMVFLYLLRKASKISKLKKVRKKKEAAAQEAARAQQEAGQPQVQAQGQQFMPSRNDMEQMFAAPEPQPVAPIHSMPLTLKKVVPSSEILYIGDKLGLKVNIHNQKPVSIQSVTVKPFFDNSLYLIDSEQKELSAVGPGQHGEVIFELQPQGLLQNAIFSGVVTFYDMSSGQYRNIDLNPVQTDLMIPELIASPVDLNIFRDHSSRMLSIDELISEIALPAPIFHELIIRSLDELNFFHLPSDGGGGGGGSFNLEAGPVAGGGGGDDYTHRYFAKTSFGSAVALECSILERGARQSELKVNIWASNQKELTLFYNIILFKLGQSIQTTSEEEILALERAAQAKQAQEQATTTQAVATTQATVGQGDIQAMMSQLQNSVQNQLRLFGTAMMKGGNRDDVFQEVFPFHIKDLFLIEKQGGRLMKHISKHTAEGDGIDRDVVSSMFTAIQDFIGDSFKMAQGSTLNELKYGDSNILIEHSDDVFIALVTSGEPPSYVRLRMADLLNNVGVSLNISQWDGDSSAVDPLVPKLQGFIEECEKEQEKKDYTKALETLEEAREELDDLMDDEISSPEGRRFLTIAKTSFKNGEYATSIKNCKLAIGAMKKDRKERKSKKAEKDVDDLEMKVGALLNKIGSKKKDKTQAEDADGHDDDEVMEVEED